MSIADIAYTHCATYNAGTIGYIAPRKRGTVDVWHDSKRYVYRPRGLYGAKTFRQFIVYAWGGVLAGTLKIRGAWPSYCLE